jgi:hypothetical protein
MAEGYDFRTEGPASPEQICKCCRDADRLSLVATSASGATRLLICGLGRNRGRGNVKY